MREKLIKRLRRDARKILRENWKPAFNLLTEEPFGRRFRLAIRLIVGRKVQHVRFVDAAD